MKPTRVISLLLLLCMLLSLVSCGEKKPEIKAHLVYDAASDTLRDEERGISYAFASVSYEPAYVGDAYADWQDTILYEVEGWSSKKLLTEEYEGVGGLIYDEKSPLPTLDEMEADKIYCCLNGKTCIQIVEDKDVIGKAVELLTTGEAVELPTDGIFSMSMKFASNQYAGIYYSVLYIEMGDTAYAERYLYDRGTKRCVSAGDLFLGTLYYDVENTEESREPLKPGDDIEIKF